MSISEVYQLIRKMLFELVFFFFLLGVLWVVLAIVILLYPYALNVLVAMGFFVMAIIALYAMIRIGVLFHQVKKFKKKFLKK